MLSIFQHTNNRSVKFKFFILCVSQLISLIGLGLTGFALSLVLYQSNEVVTVLGLYFLMDRLPAIIISPFAGEITDRFDRKKLLVLTHMFGSIVACYFAAILLFDQLIIELVYLGAIFGSIVRTFDVIIFQAIIPQVVGKNRLMRAISIGQMITASSNSLAPILGGFLIGIISASGVVVLNVIGFVLSVLLISYFLYMPTTNLNSVTLEPVKASSIQSYMHRVITGWKYVIDCRPMRNLLLFMASINFIVGMLHVLITPLILGLSNELELGAVLSFGALGMLCGSIVLIILGVPKRYGHTLLAIGGVEAIFVMMIGIFPNTILVAIFLFSLFFCFPFFGSCSQTVWQRKVSAKMQGRVIAVKQASVWIGLVLAYSLSGILADAIFIPFMESDSFLVDYAKIVVNGTGKDRGIGLMFVCMGLIIIMIVLITKFFGNLDDLDRLPDRIQ